MSRAALRCLRWCAAIPLAWAARLSLAITRRLVALAERVAPPRPCR